MSDKGPMYWRVLNTVLTVVFLALLVAYMVKVASFVLPSLEVNVIAGAPRAEVFSKWSALLRDLVYITAIIIAGVWSYYVFVRGRTFQPRLRLAITRKDIVACRDPMTIVTFRFENIGKSKITEFSVQADFFGIAFQKEGEGQTSTLIDHIADLLKPYREHASDIILEPGDTLTVDAVLPNHNNVEAENIADSDGWAVLKVHAIVEVARGRKYQEIRLLGKKLEDKS